MLSNKQICTLLMFWVFVCVLIRYTRLLYYIYFFLNIILQQSSASNIRYLIVTVPLLEVKVPFIWSHYRAFHRSGRRFYLSELLYSKWDINQYTKHNSLLHPQERHPPVMLYNSSRCILWYCWYSLNHAHIPHRANDHIFLERWPVEMNQSDKANWEGNRKRWRS